MNWYYAMVRGHHGELVYTKTQAYSIKEATEKCRAWAKKNLYNLDTLKVQSFKFPGQD